MEIRRENGKVDQWSANSHAAGEGNLVRRGFSPKSEAVARSCLLQFPIPGRFRGALTSAKSFADSILPGNAGMMNARTFDL
jgi:hypothetical protein